MPRGAKVPHAHDEEGVVLLLVLVLLVLCISTVYAFTHTTTLQVMASRHRVDLARAEMLARSGQKIAVRVIRDSARVPLSVAQVTGVVREDEWRHLSRQPIPVPGGELRITIEDAGSRVNLNALMDTEGEPWPDSLEFLEVALERIVENMPGRNEDKPYDPQALATAILDWMDANQVTESFGDDEQRFYLRNPSAVSAPVDRPIFSIEELAGIPGMDRELLATLREYFSTHPMRPVPGSGGVNPNTAEPHVLGLICHGLEGEGCRLFSRDDVFSVLRLRDEVPFCEVDLNSDSCVSFASELDLVGEQIFPGLEYSGNVFAIRTEARYGSTRACLTTTIADAARGSTPRTLYYRMGC